jgi:integrase
MAGLHLVRRRGVYWWRRRIPAELRAASSDCDLGVNDRFMPEGEGPPPDTRALRGRSHVAVSLRTRCPREARRRAVRLTALCDYAWSLCMAIATENGHAPHPLTLAGGVLSVLGRGIDAFQSALDLHPGDPLLRAEAEDRAEAGLRTEIRLAAEMPGRASADPQRHDGICPDMPPSPHMLYLKGRVAALTAQDAALTDRLARWDDYEVILGRIETLCAGMQPTDVQAPPAPAEAPVETAGEPLAQAAAAAEGLPHDGGEAAACRPQETTPSSTPTADNGGTPPETKVEPDAEETARAALPTPLPDADPPAACIAPHQPRETAASLVPKAPAKGRARETGKARAAGTGEAGSVDPDRISVLGREWLDLKCAGYLLKRRKETPIPHKGDSFRTNSRKNIESTISLLVDLFGDVCPDRLTDDQIEEMIDLLQKLPFNWGRSSRDRRTVREIVNDTDRKERLAVMVARQAAKDMGASEGNIEAACADARIPRLATGTCVRHMRDASRILDHWVRVRRIERNPLKDYLWTQEEIDLRKLREADRERRPWGGKLANLLATPVFTNGPGDDCGDPLFWAPLIAELGGLRMEEVLQLGPDDVEEEEGIVVLRVQITNGFQRLKSRNARRSVPVHRSLIELGFPELVALRRRQGERRLFPHLKRGTSKGSLSEMFSKHYRRYRERHKVYDKQRDFHSHRTGFFTNLRAAGVPLDARKMLMGHVERDMSIVHYDPDRFSLRQLHDFVNRIEIDVSGIARPFGPKEGARIQIVGGSSGRRKP